MKSKRLLPTLTAFKALSLAARTRVFLKWLRTQKGAYRFIDRDNCPLAHFGKAITKKALVGGTDTFRIYPEHIRVFDDNKMPELLACSKDEDETYPKAVKRLVAYLKR